LKINRDQVVRRATCRCKSKSCFGSPTASAVSTPEYFHAVFRSAENWPHFPALGSKLLSLDCPQQVPQSQAPGCALAASPCRAFPRFERTAYAFVPAALAKYPPAATTIKKSTAPRSPPLCCKQPSHRQAPAASPLAAKRSWIRTTPPSPAPTRHLPAQ